jgi:predicted RNase H-like nuclease (RuvC/YqgF family)
VAQSSSFGVVQNTVDTARAQLDDLTAELEAGTRFVARIERGVAALDGRLSEHQHQRDEVEQLARRLNDLRDSLRQQRILMKQLRECFDTLRRQIAGRP